MLKFSDNIITADPAAINVAISNEKTTIARLAAWGEVPLSCAHLKGTAAGYSGWYKGKVNAFGERIGARRMTVRAAEKLTGLRLPGHGSRHVWVV